MTKILFDLWTNRKLIFLIKDEILHPAEKENAHRALLVFGIAIKILFKSWVHLSIGEVKITKP